MIDDMKNEDQLMHRCSYLQLSVHQHQINILRKFIQYESSLTINQRLQYPLLFKNFITKSRLIDQMETSILFLLDHEGMLPSNKIEIFVSLISKIQTMPLDNVQFSLYIIGHKLDVEASKQFVSCGGLKVFVRWLGMIEPTAILTQIIAICIKLPFNSTEIANSKLGKFAVSQIKSLDSRRNEDSQLLLSKYVELEQHFKLCITKETELIRQSSTSSIESTIENKSTKENENEISCSIGTGSSHSSSGVMLCDMGNTNTIHNNTNSNCSDTVQITQNKESNSKNNNSNIPVSSTSNAHVYDQSLEEEYASFAEISQIGYKNTQRLTGTNSVNSTDLFDLNSKVENTVTNSSSAKHALGDTSTTKDSIRVSKLNVSGTSNPHPPNTLNNKVTLSRNSSDDGINRLEIPGLNEDLLSLILPAASVSKSPRSSDANMPTFSNVNEMLLLKSNSTSSNSFRNFPMKSTSTSSIDMNQQSNTAEPVGMLDTKTLLAMVPSKSSIRNKNIVNPKKEFSFRDIKYRQPLDEVRIIPHRGDETYEEDHFNPYATLDEGGNLDDSSAVQYRDVDGMDKYIKDKLEKKIMKAARKEPPNEDYKRLPQKLQQCIHNRFENYMNLSEAQKIAFSKNKFRKLRVEEQEKMINDPNYISPKVSNFSNIPPAIFSGESKTDSKDSRSIKRPYQNDHERILPNKSRQWDRR